MSTASKWKLWLWFNTAEKCRCLEEHEQSPESWATYSERVVGGSGGSSSGPCWWRQHGKSCWKDAKCAEVQPRDQTGLLLGIKMEKELRGGDQRGPACLGQPPSLVWTASVSPTQLTQAPWTSSSPCGRGGLSKPQPDRGAPFKASLLLWVSAHLNTAMRLFLGTQATLPASPANLHSHPPQSCASLSSGSSTHIVCFVRTVASSPSSPGYILLIMWVSLELRWLLLKESSFIPKASAQVPFLGSPNILMFP